MDLIFYGSLFIFLSLSFKLGPSTIDLGPDVVGWLLIYLGVQKLQLTDRHFTGLKIPLFILMGLTGISFTLNLISFTGAGSFLQSVASIMAIFVMFKLIAGFVSIKDSFDTPEEPLRLKKRYITTVIVQGVLVAVSVVMVLFIALSIQWEFLSGMISDISAYQGEAISYYAQYFVEYFPQVLIALLVWVLLLIAGAIVLLVFTILILVSFFRLYRNYNPNRILVSDPIPVE